MVTVNLNTPGNKSATVNQIVQDRIDTLGLKNVVHDSKTADLENISFESMIEDVFTSCGEADSKVLYREEAVGGNKEAVIELKGEDVIINFSTWGAGLSIDFYNNDQEICKVYLKDFMEKFSPKENKDENAIDINFWTFNGKNGVSYARSLKADSLEDVSQNYSEKVSEEIHALADNYEERNGKLVIFSGPPGTGKTTIIRSLLREWGERVKPDYVIDPENFFVGAPC